MSLALDLQAIRERFLEEWDREAVLTVFENAGEAGASDADPKESEPFVRFSINPGSQRIAFGGAVYSQLGRVWLQIFIPTGEGTALGYALADQFTAIFRDWRSDDGCVRTSNVSTTPVPNSDQPFYQINVSITWESIRRM